MEKAILTPSYKQHQHHQNNRKNNNIPRIVVGNDGNRGTKRVTSVGRRREKYGHRVK